MVKIYVYGICKDEEFYLNEWVKNYVDVMVDYMVELLMLEMVV